MAAITGQYQATQPTYADKDFVEVLPTDINGNLMVNIAAGETITVGTLTLGTINMVRAGTISLLNAGTIDKLGGGTVDMLKGGTINAGTIGTVAAVGIVHNAGTLAGGTLGILTDGTIRVAAGTVAVNTPGTITSGTISVNTPGTITSGSIVITAGTIGTVSNLGTIMTLQAGEDQTNDVMKVEQQFSYYNHVGTAGSTSGTVKAAAGLLHAITYNTHTSGGTYALYDSSGTSATSMGKVAPGAALAPFTSIYDVKFTTALTVVSGSACDLTFAYR